MRTSVLHERYEAVEDCRPWGARSRTFTHFESFLVSRSAFLSRIIRPPITVLKWLRDHPGVIAVVVSILAFGRTCQIEKRNAERDYLTNAMANYPRLELLDSLSLSDIDFPIDSVAILDGMPEILTSVQINAEMCFRNVGSVPAGIVCLASCDTLTGSLVLRKCILDKGLRDRFSLLPPTSFFTDREVQPSQTIKLPVERVIQHLDADSGACLHVLVLYRNPAGALYDTYYQVRLKTKEYKGSSPRKLLLEGRSHVLLGFEVACAKSDVCELVGHNVTTWLYKKPERDEIMAWLSENSSTS